ncbi:hypothetical protein FRB95_008687 [Tulasnella sp. JGI-2019a]|nr:hypothetical protein FRB95_008687 [Tulasnella sp. JGI-2019a]
MSSICNCSPVYQPHCRGTFWKLCGHYLHTDISVGTTTGGLVALDSPSSGGSKSNSKTLAITVGNVGGLFAAAVAILIYLFIQRNRGRGDHLFEVHPSPVYQHDGIAGGQSGMEEPHMYNAASVIVPYIPTSAAASGQAIDGSSKVEQPWIEFEDVATAGAWCIWTRSIPHGLWDRSRRLGSCLVRSRFTGGSKKNCACSDVVMAEGGDSDGGRLSANVSSSVYLFVRSCPLSNIGYLLKKALGLILYGGMSK